MRNLNSLLATAVCSVILTACGSSGAAAPVIAIPQPSTSAPGAKCHSENGLPDPVCTPGAVDPTVTQQNLASTICRAGYTATVRPPKEYTEPIKLKQMKDYGWTGPASEFEEDHLISLELGGAPKDPANLWPQPGRAPNPKDKVEDAANKAVCRGRMPLAEAQRQIAADWRALGRSLGLPE